MLKKHVETLFQRKAEQEAINNQCERVSQESTNRDFWYIDVLLTNIDRIR